MLNKIRYVLVAVCCDQYKLFVKSAKFNSVANGQLSLLQLVLSVSLQYQQQAKETEWLMKTNFQRLQLFLLWACNLLLLQPSRWHISLLENSYFKGKALKLGLVCSFQLLMKLKSCISSDGVTENIPCYRTCKLNQLRPYGLGDLMV